MVEDRAKDLMAKILNKKAKIGVIGLGYVGLPLAIEVAKVGYETIGFDIDLQKIAALNRGQSYIGDVKADEIYANIKSSQFRVTNDFGQIEYIDCAIICVPTPLDTHMKPDISYVEQATKKIAQNIHKGMLIILESTTYPGTTEELVKPLLQSSGLVCEKDFYLAFSPERVDPGNKKFNTKNTPKVVGGIGKDSSELATKFYESVLSSDVYVVSSPAVAEMEKLLENTYRNVNIALANEMAQLCHKMGINVWEVIEAAKSKPYGFEAFYPGPGVGGHCIPLDPSYLSWKALEYGFHTSMIEASATINDRMPKYCVERMGEILNRYQKAINGSKILVLGVSYKQDIDDYRESPALKVIAELEAKGAQVDYYDPYVPEYCFHGQTRKGIASISTEIASEYDAVMTTVAHSEVDYKIIADADVPVLDTKNAMKGVVVRNNIETL